MDSVAQGEFAPDLLDVRPEGEFRALHAIGAAGIPLEELAARVHELPPSNVAVRVTDVDPLRSHRAAEFLSERGHPVVIVPWNHATATESGPSRIRLWRANPFLVEALARIGAEDRGVSKNRRRAVDVACGSGRDAVYLAGQGYEVLAIDLLPDALRRAADLGLRCGVQIQTAVMDLESSAVSCSASLAPGEFDLVTVFRYLHRPLFTALRAAVAPGGYIVYETFHERNSESGGRPRNAAHLLGTDELSREFGDFEILISRDAVEREGRFFSSLLGRKPEK